MSSVVINYLILIVSMVITIAAQVYISKCYSKYKNIGNQSGITGFEVARKILDENGLSNIHVVETKGELSDHYDPGRKVIRLSRDVFNGNSIASVAVAAHECGHAIQDKNGYWFLKFRNFIVPFVNICSRLGYIAIFIGIIASLFDIAMFGIILLCAILIFQLITLPVEFNASSRALKEIERLKLLDHNEQSQGKTMLTAAALTYVASLVTTILEVLRLFLIISGNDRD